MTLGTPDAHLREQIADAKERQAKGEGIPGDTELAHYKEPERRKGQRRDAGIVEHRYQSRTAYQQRRIARTDRRQNAAGQVSLSIGSTTRNQAEPAPAAPASTLPLSADEVNDWYCSTLEADGSEAVRKQAMRAIELEQQVAERDREIAKWKQRAEHAAGLMELLKTELAELRRGKS